MSKNQTPRQHKFFDKHTILSVLLLDVANVILYQIIASIGGAVAGTASAGFFGAIGGVLVLVIFCRFFRYEFVGFLKENNTSVGIRIAAFMGIYYGYLLLQTAIWGAFRAPGLETIGTAIMAGVAEEAIFRGAIVSYLFRQWKDESKIRTIVIISAVLFGLVHSMNLFAGANLGITLFQVVGAMGMGALFAAIYIRSGNIFVCMVAHGLTDLIAFLDKTQTGEGGVMTSTLSLPNFIDLAICIGLFVLALYMVRPAAWPEIKALWDKKWNRAEA